MPTGAVMLVQLPEKPSEPLLQALRVGLQQELKPDEADFHSAGPLVFVKEADLPFMPVKDAGSIWLNVNIWCSYYGPGYERGDIELFVKCAEWLEQHLPGGCVYYGHDVDDENVRLFNQAARDKFIDYHRQVGTEPYYNKDEERRKRLRALWRE